MSEDFDDWNPMSDDFTSFAFNSYSSGQTAAHLPHNLSISGPEFCKTKRPPKLYVDGFPSDLSEAGLKSFLQRIGCKPLSVKIVYSNRRIGQLFSFVDFESTKEAQKAIELIQNQNIYKLSVKFANTAKDRQIIQNIIDRENEEMKQKIDLGNNSAINANSNCRSSSMSPIHSESGSQDSSHLEVLSPLAKSNKLLKVLEKLEDDCSFCTDKQNIEHLHFILTEQLVIDPNQMPELIEMSYICHSCGRKTSDMKLCSECKTATYCNRNCQSDHWPRHRIECKTNSKLNSTLNLNRTLNSINGNVSQNETNGESVEPIASKASETVASNIEKRLTKTTPVIINTVRNVPKESTPLAAESRTTPSDEGVRPLESVVANTSKASSESSRRPNAETNKLKISPIAAPEPPLVNIDWEVLSDGEEGVMIVFGRNPSDFYLQKSSVFDNLDQFDEELKSKKDSFPLLTDSELVEGALCGGIYSVDDIMYRAKIVKKINDETYALLFIDYGNTEPVNKKDIRRLPKQLFNTKAQAIHSSLENIVPKDNKWTNDAIKEFERIGETNSFSKVKIFGKTEDGVYKIDLIDKKGNSIRKLLAEKGFVTLRNELSESAPKPKPVMAPPPPPKTPQKSCDSPVLVEGSPKVTFNKSSISELGGNFTKRMNCLDENLETGLQSYFKSLELNSKLSFMIASVHNAEELQYFATVFTMELKDLIQGLAEKYSSANQTVVPKVDDIVVCKASDGDHYRSYVLSVGPETARVLMIDSGFIEVVPKDNIFKLKKKFKKISVYGALLLPDKRSSAVLIERNHVEDTTLDGTFIRKDGNLYIECNESLIEFLDFEAAVKFIKCCQQIEETVKPSDELPVRKLSINQPMEALALYQDPNDFKTFYIAGEIPIVEKLMALCTEHKEKFNDSILVNPLVGSPYLVRALDGDWYRGVITAENGDKVNVKFIDFGNDEEIDSQYIMELSEEMRVTNIEPLAVKCVVESTKLSDDELKTKIESAVNGAFLLKINVSKIEGDVHYVKVK